MKKTIILILGGAAALALSLVLGINAQSKAESVNGLFEANVEALAGVEHRGHVVIRCLIVKIYAPIVKNGLGRRV